MNANMRQPGTPIDWAAIRASLKRAEVGLEDALNPSSARAKEIMDARARVLSQAPAPPRAPGAGLDLIEFGLNKERYTIEAQFVREIVRFTEYTPVPGTPEFLIGVTNLRGVILAVVDLRRFFNVPQKGVTDLSRVIVLGTVRPEFGILADEVLGQIELPTSDILPVQGDLEQIGRAYLKGVTKDAIIVLNGAALLSDDQLYVR